MQRNVYYLTHKTEKTTDNGLIALVIGSFSLLKIVKNDMSKFIIILFKNLFCDFTIRKSYFLSVKPEGLFFNSSVRFLSKYFCKKYTPKASGIISSDQN